MNTGFDENQAEFGVLVLAITLEMLANSDSLSILSRKSKLNDPECLKPDEA